MRAGEVAVETDEELELETERKGRVGVFCRKYFNQAWALAAGTRSMRLLEKEVRKARNE